MRGYRAGLWLLTGGLLATLGLWVADDVIHQLWATQILREFPRLYLQLLGYIDLAIAIVLVAGALLARTGSEGPRRWWFTGIAVEIALYELLRLGPWLLALAHVDFSMSLATWLFRIAVSMHIAALASLALIALGETGQRKLAAAALWLTGARGILYLLVQTVTHEPRDAAGKLSELATLVGIASLLATMGVVFDLLGAFPGTNAPAEVKERSRTGSVATTTAIALAFVGVALAGLAVWGTKRVSSTETTAGPLSIGTVVFIAAATALWRLQRRDISLVKLSLATLLALGLGRVALGGYTKPASEVELEKHSVPGLQISLPEGETEVAYQYVELGKLTVMTHHADLGLVELSWLPDPDGDRPDPLEDYAKIKTASINVMRYSHQVSQDRISVNDVIWSASNTTQLYASWRCPGDARWFVLSMSRYSPGVDVIQDVATRVVDTIKCSRKVDGTSFEMPAPPDFKSTWAPRLDDDAVRIAAEIDFTHAEISKVTAKPIPHGIVEDEDRTIIEEHDKDEYRIASYWHCYTLDIDVAVYATVPATRPRESLLAAIRSAHCPR